MVQLEGKLNPSKPQSTLKLLIPFNVCHGPKSIKQILKDFGTLNKLIHNSKALNKHWFVSFQYKRKFSHQSYMYHT